MAKRDDNLVRAQLAGWCLVLYLTLTATKYLKFRSASSLTGYFSAWLLGGCVVFGIGCWLAYRWRGRVGVLVALGLAVVTTCVASFIRPKPLLAAIHATREDLAFLFALALVADAAYRLGGRRRPRLFSGLLAAVVLPLIALACLELGLFGATGSEAGWYELSFAFENPAAFVSLGSQYAGASVLPYALPFLLALGVLAIPARAVDRSRLLAATPEHGLLPPRGAFAAVLVLVAMFVAPASGVEPNLVARTRGNTFVELVRNAPIYGAGLEGPSITREAPRYEIEPYRLERRGQSAPRNVLFVVLESTRADYTTPYSPGLRTTPFLAELAGRGMTVEGMRSVIPFSAKATVPIFCGAYPKINMTLKLDGDRLPDPEICLPRLLRDHGYRTAAFTTWCGSDDSCTGWSDINQFEPRLREVGFDEIVTQEDLPTEGFPRVFPGGVPEDALLGPIDAWLGAGGPEAPFVMAVWTSATHAPFSPSPEFEGWPAQGDRAGKKPPAAKGSAYGIEVEDYYRALEYADRFLARLMGLLDRHGRSDSTLVVVVGDHGLAFGEHGRYYYERVLYEEGIHVPAILVGPGIPVVTRRGSFQQIDLVPTLVDALGMEPVGGSLPPGGVSLLRPGDPSRTLYFSCYSEGRCMALQRGDLKYHYFYRYRPMEAYDLAADPNEQHDLAPTMDRARLGAAEQELLAWRRSVNRYYDRAPQR